MTASSRTVFVFVVLKVAIVAVVEVRISQIHTTDSSGVLLVPEDTNATPATYPPFDVNVLIFVHPLGTVFIDEFKLLETFFDAGFMKRILFVPSFISIV